MFSRGEVKGYPTFSYGDDIIEVFSDYVYLGVTMKYVINVSKLCEDNWISVEMHIFNVELPIVNTNCLNPS